MFQKFLYREVSADFIGINISVEQKKYIKKWKITQMK